MLGYPPSKPSEIVYLVGILLLMEGIIGYEYFQNPFLKNASQVCGLLGMPVYFIGIHWSRRSKPFIGDPKYATSIQILAIILWLVVVPLVLFWTYIKIHQP